MQRNKIHITIKFVIGGEKVVERLVLVVVGIVVAGGIIVFQTDPRGPERAGPGVTAGDVRGERLLIEADAHGRFLETSELPGDFRLVVPTAELFRKRFDAQSEGVDVARRRAAGLWRSAGIGSERSGPGVPRQKVKLRFLLWNQRSRGGVNAGEIFIIVRRVEIVVISQHDAAHEAVDPKVLRFEPYFGGVEHPAEVVPVERADEPFVTIGELLPAHLGREWKCFGIAQPDVSLVQIKGAVRLSVRIPVIAGGRAALSFDKHGEPGAWLVTQMHPFAQQKIRVIRVSSDFAKVHRASLSRCDEIFLVLLARTELAANVPGLEEIRFASQPIIHQPGAGGSGDGPGHRGRNAVCAGGCRGRFLFGVSSVGDGKQHGARRQCSGKWSHEVYGNFDVGWAGLGPGHLMGKSLFRFEGSLRLSVFHRP